MNDNRAQLLKQSVLSTVPLQLAITEAGSTDPVLCEMGNAFALIGRSERCQIRLKHSDVSFRHAYLQNVGGRIFCVDLNSRSGTMWGDKRRRGGWLSVSDGPQIGPYQIRLAKPDVGDDSPFPNNFNPLDAIDDKMCSVGPVQLEFLNRSTIGRTWTINRMLTLVGSGTGCKIRLEDETISNVHCGLLVTQGGLWVIDFLGRGGTHVDGRPVDFACLGAGQVLRVGQFGMRVKYDSDPTSDMDLPSDNEEFRSSTEFPMGETFIRESIEDPPGGQNGSSTDFEVVPTVLPGNFVDSVVKSGLLSREQINIVTEAASEVELSCAEKAKLLVERGMLTAWQVEQISADKAQYLIVAERYRLLERLGHGSMGTVYRAYDPQMACDVAIKFPKARAFKKPRMLIRFRREAMINDKIQHPNIVRAYDVAVSGNYIVMEYVPGLNLKQFLQQSGAQSPEFAVSICVQIGEALQFAYRNGVTHRDIKPSNILLSADGTAKLLDLGLARLDDDPDSETEWGENQTAQMTQAGVQLGTTRYMAPEQAADGHSADVRSDIYGLVCTLYNLLAGHPPFDAENPVKIMMMHAQDPVSPISGVDERLTAIIEKGLAKKPVDRFQTPADLVDRLRDWLTIRELQQEIEALRQTRPTGDNQNVDTASSSD
ncbi:Serine/threonine-protein kinase PknB [Symmachiella macrocystis]|uniref:Serine/threonine-protein kinase PknB n=1 Tax=Symmachiella macrocystis TaxID=2527985 RepID=A0A5C6B8Y2_9PLAN|nr:FHA domain-containing serine/threonine-protein kinase [Symmachiella macrocystis]TWU08735.1 Serine/threonine-protein kinase PknB [Symmachiella macrocystis]